MPAARKVIAQAGILMAVAIVLGITSNALRSDGLPLVRKPLSETRPVVKREALMAEAPQRKPNTPTSEKPTAIEPAPATVSPETPIKESEPVKPKTEIAPTREAKKPKPSAQKIQALFTNLDDAKACFDNKSAIFLDARAVEDFEAEHIAGALWLGYESFEEDYQKVLGKIPKDRLLVTYCSDVQCSSAIKLADALVARGHTRVVIMLEGLPGWTDAGYPTSSGMKAGD